MTKKFRCSLCFERVFSDVDDFRRLEMVLFFLRQYGFSFNDIPSRNTPAHQAIPQTASALGPDAFPLSLIAANGHSYCYKDMAFIVSPSSSDSEVIFVCAYGSDVTIFRQLASQL